MFLWVWRNLWDLFENRVWVYVFGIIWPLKRTNTGHQLNGFPVQTPACVVRNRSEDQFRCLPIQEKLGCDSDKPVSFVFHGGSGSSLEDIRYAIEAGVVKMNIDTDTQWATWSHSKLG